ncbi:MAG: TolB-like protein [Kangiellaceae bacterium]|jgi:TolB-like protein
MKNVVNSIGSVLLCVLCVLIILTLSGCANLLSQQAPIQKSSTTSALGNSELITFRLAQELFANMQADKQYRYAVAGFVPVTSMQTNLNEQGPLMLLGHQLEQGLITEAVRRGFVAQDYKASNAIIMTDLYDRVLSRDLDHLSQLQNVDYYITGTITPQQNGAMVNARVINVRSKDVVAAATRFFPADLFWEKEQVTLRNGQLYRTEKPSNVSTNLE